MELSIKFTKEELKELEDALNVAQIHSLDDNVFQRRGILLNMVRALNQLTPPSTPQPSVL